MSPVKSHSQKFKVVHGVSFKFFTYYTTEGEDSFQRIITGDENWVCYWTPSIKKASMMWKTAEEPTLLTLKNIDPLERSWPLFFGTSTVSCYSNFVHKR